MTTDTLEALREAREALGRIIDVADRTSWAVNTSLMDASITEARAALATIDAALAPDHIGNSTTMVPTLGVAQIKATIWKHWRNQNGQTLEDRFTSAAEEIADLTPRI